MYLLFYLFLLLLQARVQHTERAIDFLVKELKVCSQKEAAERVFFISAKECLQARCKEQQGLALQSKYIVVTLTKEIRSAILSSSRLENNERETRRIIVGRGKMGRSLKMVIRFRLDYSLRVIQSCFKICLNFLRFINAE